MEPTEARSHHEYPHARIGDLAFVLVDRRYHHANQPATITGDPLPLYSGSSAQ